MEKTTILIVDDHTLIRETWTLILNSNPAFSVIGEAKDAQEGIDLARSLCPAVVIMDINLPGMNGIEATGVIRKISPASKVLGVSLHTQPAYARMMMREGASGYVTKNSSREEMFTAIDEVMEGKNYICKEIKNIISEQMLSDGGTKNTTDRLSKREVEISLLIKEGLSSKEIAVMLNLSVKTVEVHRYNMLQKLKLKNTAALVNYITQHHSSFGLN